MEISVNDALLLQNKGNKILFAHTHTHKKAQGYKQSVCLYQQSMT